MSKVSTMELWAAKMTSNPPHNKAFQPTRYSGLFFRSFAIFATEKPAVTVG
jgi:hypothetical protein